MLTLAGLVWGGVVERAPFPVQVIWGERDPALPIAKHGEAVRRAAGVPEIIRLPGKHFLQEDQAPALADHIARFVDRSQARATDA